MASRYKRLTFTVHELRALNDFLEDQGITTTYTPLGVALNKIRKAISQLEGNA